MGSSRIATEAANPKLNAAILNPVSNATQLSKPLLRDRLGVWDRVGLVMVRLATITCEKCGRRWLEPLRERYFTNFYGQVCMVPWAQSAPRCSECSPPRRQPREGETFRQPGHGRGKFILLGWRDLDGGNGLYWDGESFGEGEPRSMDETLTELALRQSWAAQEQAERNRLAQEAEQILTPGWITERAGPDDISRALALLASASRADLSRRLNVTEHVVRAGKTPHVLALLAEAERQHGDRSSPLNSPETGKIYLP